MSICAMPTPASASSSNWHSEPAMAYVELIGLIAIFIGIAVIVLRSD